MIERKVTKSQKDKDGDITALCNSGQPWSPRFKKDAISDIDSKICNYYVETEGKKVEVIVVNEAGKKYLRTSPDKTKKNNLDDLPDC